MKPFLAAIVLTSLALAGTGCKSACVQLSEKICDCQATQNDRDACNSQASARASQVNPSSQDEATCQALIDKCNCHELNTPQGKVDCGLARPGGSP